MPNRFSKQLFGTFLSQEVSEDILKGVVICEVGEAKGHGFYLGSRFLEQVVLIGNRKQIKVRVDHPEEGKSGKVLSIVGQAFNFRIDGEKVRADIRLFDVPAKKIIQQLAKQASNLFGMSLDFTGKIGKKLKNGLDEVFCKDLDAVDFVESPAATNALFSEKVDSQNEDETQTDDKSENLNLQNIMDKEILAALGLEEGADEKSIKAAILAACAAKKSFDEKSEDKSEEKMDDSDDKKDEGDEKLADESKDEKKEEKEVEAKASSKKEGMKLDEKQISEIVAEQVAKQFTAMLAKTGGKAKVSTSTEEKSSEKKEDDKNFGFNDEEVLFAKKNDINLKEWRATLNKAAERTVRFQKS